MKINRKLINLGTWMFVVECPYGHVQYGYAKVIYVDDEQVIIQFEHFEDEYLLLTAEEFSNVSIWVTSNGIPYWLREQRHWIED